VISKLALQDGFWPLLALDHGLTVGNRDSVDIANIPRILSDCADSVSASVMTYGVARTIQRKFPMPIIIQCFGAPLNHPKIQVCSVDDALRIGASGVAVQVNFRLEGRTMLDQLKSVARFSSESHARNLPVLFMVAPHEMSDLEDLCHSMRFCIELGADLIKVKCDSTGMSSDESQYFGRLLRESPPILLAGGTKSAKIIEEAKAAKALGFSGYCIGRNIFQSPNPGEVARSLREAWTNSIKQED